MAERHEIPDAPNVPTQAEVDRILSRRRFLTGAGVVVLVAAPVALSYRRQVVSYLSKWKGKPHETVPYVPHDPAPALHLLAIGDIGDSGERLDRVAGTATALAAILPYDVVLLLGDNVYPYGDPAGLQDTVFSPLAPVLDSGAELLAILGNHDVMQGHGDEQLAVLGVPGRWWARELGPLLLVGIDTNDIGNRTQLAWLEETLAAATAPWKVVAMHHSPYSAGYQGSSLEARRVFAPLFERHGVQLVLSGHDHDYQRSVPQGGVTYVVAGAGSDTRRTGEEDFTAVSWSFLHVLDIAIDEDRLVVRAVDTDGRVADELVLTTG
jgi:predicted MPP superfamily phosphohydrolase